jgi:hypothetical protein
MKYHPFTPLSNILSESGTPHVCPNGMELQHYFIFGSSSATFSLLLPVFDCHGICVTFPEKLKKDS